MIHLYVPVNSYEEAQREMARIRQHAEEQGIKIFDLIPSSAFGQFEGEQAIKAQIESTGNDPTTCIKGTASERLHLWDEQEI